MINTKYSANAKKEIFHLNSDHMVSYITCEAALYRHSLIYAVDVGIHKKNAEIKNRVNRGYLVVSNKGEENRIEL